MLVLTRKKDESIMVGDDVEIFIVEIRGDKVRLGINAPKEVPVHRREVFDAIKREQEKREEADPKERWMEQDKERGYHRPSRFNE